MGYDEARVRELRELLKAKLARSRAQAESASRQQVTTPTDDDVSATSGPEDVAPPLDGDKDVAD